MRWPAKHLQELQPIIYGIAWAPMLQCGRSQTFFVLAKSVGSLSVNRIIRSKVAASDLVRSTEAGALTGGQRAMARGSREEMKNEPHKRILISRLALANASPRCGARTRRGSSCQGAAMANGRCRMHGGPRTGPRTPEGLERSRRANWKHGR